MAMVSNKFLAALAVKLGFHRHVRKHGTAMDRVLLEFTEDLVNTEEKYKGDVSFWTHLSEPIPKVIASQDITSAFYCPIIQNISLRL